MLISTVVFVPLGTLLPLMVQNYFFGTAWHIGIMSYVLTKEFDTNKSHELIKNEI